MILSVVLFTPQICLSVCIIQLQQCYDQPQLLDSTAYTILQLRTTLYVNKYGGKKKVELLFHLHLFLRSLWGGCWANCCSLCWRQVHVELQSKTISKQGNLMCDSTMWFKTKQVNVWVMGTCGLLLHLSMQSRKMNWSLTRFCENIWSTLFSQDNQQLLQDDSSSASILL